MKNLSKQKKYKHAIHIVSTQIRGQIWIAVDQHYKMPRNFPFPLRIIRMSIHSLNCGIEIKTIAGNILRIFNPSKTIADCFKYRTKVGSDVAIEALRNGLKTKLATSDQIYEFSKIDRVSQIMKPYLEYAVND